MDILLFFTLETSVLWETRVYNQDARLVASFGTSAVVAPFVGFDKRRMRDINNPLLLGCLIVLIGTINWLLSALQEGRHLSAQSSYVVSDLLHLLPFSSL